MRPQIRFFAAVPLVVLVAGLAGCADGAGSAGSALSGGSGATRAAGYWTPEATPAFVEIDRERTMVVTEDDSREMLVVVTDGRTGDRPAGRFTWIVSLPANTPAGATLKVNEGDAWAWVHHDVGGRRGVVELVGAVTITERSADRVTASLSLAAEDGVSAPTLWIDAGCVRVAKPSPVKTPALRTAGGVPHRAPTPKEPRRPTDPVWPWGEIIGVYPRE